MRSGLLTIVLPAETTWRYDALDRLVESQYPLAKIQGIRAQYFSPTKLLRPAPEEEPGARRWTG